MVLMHGVILIANINNEYVEISEQHTFVFWGSTDMTTAIGAALLVSFTVIIIAAFLLTCTKLI